MSSKVIVNIFSSLLLFTQIVYGVEESCYSLNLLSSNKDFCDRQEVLVEGEVKNLKFDVSAKGNKYTTFNFKEGNETFTVFSYNYLPVAEKDIVKVKGTYFTDYAYEVYTFPNQINTQPSDVVVLKARRLVIGMYGGASLFILLLAGALLLLKKNREKAKRKVKYDKGYEFEKYAIPLFEEKHWQLESITPDISSEVGRRVKSDSDPDIIVKNKIKQLKFALECKFRAGFSSHNDGKKSLKWAEDYQIKHYSKFEEENDIPVYILLGIGNPEKPERTFLIPLKAIKQRTYFYEDYIQQFERGVNEPFRLEGNWLK